MYLKLEELINIYKEAKANNPNLFIYDEVETCNYDYVYKEGFNVNVKMIKNNNKYKIFIFISKQGILLFNGILKESNSNLIDYYNVIVNELNSLSIEDLISKYYEDLKENF